MTRGGCVARLRITRRRRLRFNFEFMSEIFKDHFSGVANRYADFRPHYPAEIFDYLATLVPGHAAVWDCACGNGQATHDLAARFASVIATDASKEQIASAKPNPKVKFQVATAET